MPDFVKKDNGEVDYTKIFMGFAVALVLIMQQYQTMHIAEIKTQGEVNRINFMEKDEIDAIQETLMKRIAYVELHTMPKDTVSQILNTIDNRLSSLEDKNHTHFTKDDK